MAQVTRGFTILEVLLAIALAAILVTASVTLMGQNHRTQAHLRQKIAADLAARNLMDRHLITSNAKLALAFEEGKTKMGGYEFSYEQVVTPAAIPELKLLTIKVYDIEKKQVFREISMYAAEESQ